MTAPWLFWGSDQEVRVRSEIFHPPQGIPQLSAQLARIDYGRPETWSFFLGARLNEITPAPSAAPAVQIVVTFLTTIGLARTARPIRLGRLVWKMDGTPPVEATRGQFAWTTQSRSPIHFPLAATPLPEDYELVTSFAAQSINCQAEITMTSGPSGLTAFTADMTVSAFFAPLSHVRPEWFKDGNFSGGENYGT